jgi:hypothetical protein
MVVFVKKKVPARFIPPAELLPRKVYVGSDAIEVDVVETGPFYTFAFTTRDRPAPSGISIGHPNVTAGTLGCLVNDNTDGSLCILSNNHVIADGNLANLGDAIIQPGTADGGSTPADDIATLKRFIPIDCTATNRVDAAIAEVITRADVVAEFKNNLMPYPGPDHPAVGLLFAGSCNRTIFNPIDDVLNQLNIQFLAGAGSTVRADVGMNVEKVGRTTEYTTSTVQEIDATVTIGGYPCGSAMFDNQFTTCWMSAGGDSGSVGCQGGEGGCEDDCGCASAATAAQILSLDLGIDKAVESEFRRKYLSKTLIGKYAIDTYFRNEDNVVRRAREAKMSESDAEYARHLYNKYADDVRQALLQPDRSDFRITSEHLEDARQGLGRAKEHMTKEEARAADQLFELAQKAVGKNVREILDMLNDKRLYEQVVRIVSNVPTIKKPDCDC